jgi:hypothetical protein
MKKPYVAASPAQGPTSTLAPALTAAPASTTHTTGTRPSPQFELHSIKVNLKMMNIRWSEAKRNNNYTAMAIMEPSIKMYKAMFVKDTERIVKGFGRLQAAARVDAAESYCIATFLVDQGIDDIRVMRGMEDAVKELMNACEEMGTKLEYGDKARLTGAFRVAAKPMQVFNIQGDYNEAKKCEGSGNAGKYGGAAQVVCCSTKYGQCCASAAVAGNVPDSLKNTELTDTSTGDCPKNTFADH